MTKSLQDHHNQGQSDASDNKYDPPHDLIDHVIGAVFHTQEHFERSNEENKAYDTGHSNADKQK